MNHTFYRYPISIFNKLLILFLAIQGRVSAQSPVISYQTPQVYNISTAINPLTPLNTGGVIPANAYGQVSTFERTEQPSPNNTTANYNIPSFVNPVDFAFDKNGLLYVADPNSIRTIDANGIVTFVGGCSISNYSNGPIHSGCISSPRGMAIDAAGNIYVADYYVCSIRKVTPQGDVSLYAGTSHPGNMDGPGASASFSGCADLVMDAAGNLFVADQYNNLIRKITPANVVSTFAGSGLQGSADGVGTAAGFNLPQEITIDAAGNLYVAEQDNLIRKITPLGVVTTLAGNGSAGSVNGTGSQASFNNPRGLAIDASGNVYVSDQNNNLIRMITQAGMVSTLAGTGFASDQNGPANTATFNSPSGIIIDSQGNLLVADENNNLIRKITLTGYAIDKPLPDGLIFDSTTGIVSGTPTTASAPANYTITAYNKYGSSSAVVSIAVAAVQQSAVQPPAISYQTPQSYTINTTITPLMPVNTGGAVPATIYGQVSTYATGFNNTTGVAVDASGNVFADDFLNNEIKKIDPAGNLTVFAGGGSGGAVNGQGTAASFSNPDGLIADQAGNLYVSDLSNQLIRKITPSGLVSTFAGSGVPGSTDGSGTFASFYNPRGLAIDAAGNVYVADQQNNLIRKITAAGVVTTIAGNGAAGFGNGTGIFADFNTPTGVGLDNYGNIYVADAGNNAIRKITPAGAVTTFATGFNFPREIRFDGTGNSYISDQQSNSIKMISSTGVITTVAGTGQEGANDGSGNVATFWGPLGLALDGKGNLFVGDDGNGTVRKVIVSGYTIDKALPTGLSFDPLTGIISGAPTVLSPATNYTVTAFNGGGSNSTVVNLEVVSLKQSIITFPPQMAMNIPADDILPTGVTSTNTETPVTYTSSDPSVAYVGSDGQIHVIAPGVTVITAYQAGDANYSPATPVSQPFTIMEYQVIFFPVITVKTTCDADFSSDAVSSNSILPVTYTSSNPAVATISADGTVHIAGPGTTTLTASQDGNSLYYPAQPQSQILTVNPPVSPLVSISPDHTTVCAGTQVTFTAAVSNLTSDLSYQWTVNGINAGSNSPTFITSLVTAADVFQCLVTNNASCQATGASNNYSGIVVNPLITPSIAITSSATAPVCSGTAITFTAIATNGGTNPTYQWQVNGVNAGTNSPVFDGSNFSDGDMITCILTNNTSSCLTVSSAMSNTAVVSLITPADPAPSVIINAPVNSIYAGTLLAFTATPLNAGMVTSFQWQVNNVNVGSNRNIYSSNNFKNGDVITCTIISSVACSAPATSAPFTITVLPPIDIVIPNTFTPNGDGINDYWDIPALESYPNCLLSIYDRYGSLIYQSKGYSRPWDGTSNGKTLPFATYYYIIDLGSKNQKLSGHVTIIR